MLYLWCIHEDNKVTINKTNDGLVKMCGCWAWDVISNVVVSILET